MSDSWALGPLRILRAVPSRRATLGHPSSGASAAPDLPRIMSPRTCLVSDCLLLVVNEASGRQRSTAGALEGVGFALFSVQLALVRGRPQWS